MVNKWQNHCSIVARLRAATKSLIAALLIMSSITVVNSGVVMAGQSQPLEEDLKEYIKLVEASYLIPPGLLGAVVEVESGLKPYAVNINGNSVIARSFREAADLVRKALASGVTNIDIGVAQINYRWHQKDFSNIEQMLSPQRNLDYAGKLLSDLYRKYGSWNLAVRYYHSSKSPLQRSYSRKILVSWLAS